jgi:uncharacterized protein (DUF3820 family)
VIALAEGFHAEETGVQNLRMLHRESTVNQIRGLRGAEIRCIKGPLPARSCRSRRPSERPLTDFQAKHAAWKRRQSIYGTVVLGFGKHRGKPLKQIPADYLLWVLENCTRLSFSTREAIKNYLFYQMGP